MDDVNHSVTNPTNLFVNNELHLYFHFKPEYGVTPSD